MFSKLTVKIPLEYVEYIKEQAKLSGEGVQALAGKVFMHGLIDLRNKQVERLKNEHIHDK